MVVIDGDLLWDRIRKKKHQQKQNPSRIRKRYVWVILGGSSQLVSG